MKPSKTPAPGKFFVLAGALLLLIVIACLFWRAFLPDYIVFSNDGPLGLQKAAWLSLPQGFFGQWYDLNSIGVNGGTSLPDFSTMIRWFIGPVGYAKFLIPVSLCFLGLSALFFFRRSGLSVTASIVGCLAACLTTNYFSNACWGAAPPIIAFGMDFLALGALTKKDNLPFWVAPALAGLAVGVNVMEAADIGALFSLVVAAFVMYQSMATEGSTFGLRTARGIGRTVIVALFAGFIAAYAISGLIGAAISGIAGTQQDEQTKAAHWDFATEWSLPKHETLALAVPNLFGCSIITPGAANYWGGIGSDPSWERYLASGEKGPLPQGFMRHTGRGIYIGILVVFIAFWAALQSFQKKSSVFTLWERKLIWFWCVVAAVSLLLAWGRWAWFYRLLYVGIPYFSTIRNPEKFIHIITFATLILFAYGVDGLHRRYLAVPLANVPKGRLKTWWAQAPAFDKRWVIGSFLMICLMLIAWAVYAQQRGSVEDYLVNLQRIQNQAQGGNPQNFDAHSAHAFAASQLSFSLRQVGWCVLFLAAGSISLLVIFSGAFAGRRAVFAGVLLGALVTGDLVHADLPYNNPFQEPYTGYWNYKQKYEVGDPEPIIKFLAAKPYEQRVAYVLSPPLSTPDAFQQFLQLYNIEWTQQLFPFYNIQTLDIVQMPRMPEDLIAFDSALQVGFKADANGNATFDDKTFYRVGRLWQLTATRYLVGPAPVLGLLNQQFFTSPNSFRVLRHFDLGPRPGLTNVTQYSDIDADTTDNPNAPYALFEFTGALSRATLFSNWEVQTNSNAALGELASASFDPSKTVLLSRPPPAGMTPSPTNQNPGSVKITSYEPADIKLEAAPTVASVLMLADKYDPAWQVWVDGKRAEVLRCDYLLRGVYLAPGKHEVEFRFRLHVKMLYVNIAAIVFGLCLLGYALVARRKEPKQAPTRPNAVTNASVK